MAENEPIDTHTSGQLLAADLKNQVKHRVRGVVEALVNGADELHGLAVALELHASLSSAAGPEELRQTAVGVRAVATQAFMTAITTAGISERLTAWAEVSGILFPATGTWREPERAGD